tara:strand:- start:363 stop:992 length:630 start_codon:yes stop_codon:yes gene_type:complete
VIDIIAIKESKSLINGSTQISNNFKWDKKKIRYDVWDKFILKEDFTNQKIQFLEFGVYKGESIKYFAEKLLNKENIFIGYDTFFGLPADWQSAQKGMFSTDGKVPESDDKRIRFVKGLFQKTFDNSIIDKNVKTIIHFDADMYSSTLFLLLKLHEVLDEYYFIFDELEGEELRALKDYMQIYNIDIEISYYSKFNGLITVATGQLKIIK